MKGIKGVAFAALFVAGIGLAQADEYSDPMVDDSPSAGAMAVDLLIVRPVSFVGTVGGVALFILNLPLSLIQGEPPSKAAEQFIVEPARYTFERPLGDMD